MRFCGRERTCRRTGITTRCDAPLHRGDKIESAVLDGGLFDEDFDEYDWGCRVCALFPDSEHDPKDRHYLPQVRYCSQKYWNAGRFEDREEGNAWALSHLSLKEREILERLNRPNGVIEDGWHDITCASRGDRVIDQDIELNLSYPLVPHVFRAWLIGKSEERKSWAEPEDAVRRVTRHTLNYNYQTRQYETANSVRDIDQLIGSPYGSPYHSVGAVLRQHGYDLEPVGERGYRAVPAVE